MRVVIVVPWRAGNRIREENWLATAPYLQALGDWPIYLGDREGPWSRSAACNQGAKDAGPWDICIFADADTIPEKSAVMEAVDRVTRNGGSLRPHTNLWMLNPGQTKIVVKQGIGARPKKIRFKNMGGGLLVVSRSAYEKVGGFDERFVGWGHEDSALTTRLVVEASWDQVEGSAWHLWHPRDDTDTPERRRNRVMMLREQMRYSTRLDEISAERGFDIRSVL